MPFHLKTPLLSRRLAVLTTVFLLQTLLFIALGEHSRQNYAMQHFVYSSSNENGITLSRYNESTGEISAPVLQHGAAKSFFIATHLSHPAGPRLYSLDAGEGTASAFSIAEDGTLSLLNTTSTEGKVPCHLLVDAERSLLFVANYNGDTVALPILKDGSLGPVSGTHHQPGSSIEPRRQTGTHPHGLALSGDTLYVADLGTDDIASLTIGEEGKRLTPIAAGDLKLKAGAGPRHITFHRDGRRAVVVNELDNTVTAALRDPATGALSIANTLSTLPEGHAGESWTAEIIFHPSLDLCYATNRGAESIALFSINAEGHLTQRHLFPAGGKFPQHLSFTESGRTLFVANTNSGHIVRFDIDPATGLPTGDAQECHPLAKPMCVLSIPAAALSK